MSYTFAFKKDLIIFKINTFCKKIHNKFVMNYFIGETEFFLVVKKNKIKKF